MSNENTRQQSVDGVKTLSINDFSVQQSHPLWWRCHRRVASIVDESHKKQKEKSVRPWSWWISPRFHDFIPICSRGSEWQTGAGFRPHNYAHSFFVFQSHCRVGEEKRKKRENENWEGNEKWKLIGRDSEALTAMSWHSRSSITEKIHKKRQAGWAHERAMKSIKYSEHEHQIFGGFHRYLLRIVAACLFIMQEQKNKIFSSSDNMCCGLCQKKNEHGGWGSAMRQKKWKETLPGLDAGLMCWLLCVLCAY